MVRRIGETVFATVPVMAALFVPLLLGLHDLYEWSHAEAVAKDALLRWKAPYLNVPFFLIRAALYFGIWSFIAVLLPRLARSGRDGDPGVSARPAPLRRARHHRPRADQTSPRSTGSCRSRRTGIRPSSASISSRALSSGSSRYSRSSRWRCAGRAARHGHQRRAPARYRKAFRVHGVLDLYRFSQFFLIWYANLPEETIRIGTDGRVLDDGLALPHGGHFVAPFFYLMGRTVKRNGSDSAVGERGSSPCIS